MGALDHASLLERLSPEENLLVQNYRRCDQDRRDALLHMSGHVAKHCSEDHACNVLVLVRP